NCRKS
ncbi:Ditrans,polycis-undecaprenyl-diphosphate synthase ((2E,6E)-farnesyl-diphosphate specific), partial [Haemophilus influenzae]